MEFKHPKYYAALRAELRKLQASSSKRQATDPEATSYKPQAPSKKVQASSHKLQAPRFLNQETIEHLSWSRLSVQEPLIVFNCFLVQESWRLKLVA